MGVAWGVDGFGVEVAIVVVYFCRPGNRDSRLYYFSRLRSPTTFVFPVLLEVGEWTI